MRFFQSAVAALAIIGSLFGADARKHSNPLFAESAPSEMVYQDMFTAYMKQYTKKYSHDEFSSRYEQFKKNIEVIRLHNTQTNSSYSMGLNEFADISFDEFKEKYFGFKKINNEFLRSKNYHVSDADADVPTAVDWRTSNAVTPVKNQGMCGSCWAFSTTGAVEGAWVLQGKKSLVSLSEQQLVDCAQAQGNQGCNGGLMDYGFQYIIDNKGICSEDSYAYTATDGTCKKTCEKVVTISGFKDIKAGDETALYNAVGTYGPVSVAIEADQQGFQFYSSGVFDGACGTNLDHGVLAVGYGVDSGKNYWIVKNSWGASWGEQGYIRMIRGKNQCGITAAASYPTI